MRVWWPKQALGADEADSAGFHWKAELIVFSVGHLFPLHIIMNKYLNMAIQSKFIQKSL
jgi:hypothetical protein